ncbi:MAG: hypothetical protein HY335_09445 [Deinococcus sp.]|nr:hypothetical protein [Deinococcus sp.]
MKMEVLQSKLILGTLIGLLILGQTLAGNNASMNVTATIPAVGEIRLTHHSSDEAITNPSLTFTPTASQILSAAEGPIYISPLTTPSFDRVSYLVNRGGSWSVAVKALGTPSLPEGLSLSDVQLLYSPDDGDGNPAGGNTLSLSTSDQTVDSNSKKTNSFRHTSLAYQLYLNGDEAEGNVEVVLQFTLTTP